MKRSLVITIALALLACVALYVALRSQPDETDIGRLLDTARGPSFAISIVVPRMGLPFAGILPDWFAKTHDLTPRELRLDHTSPGAKIGSAGPDRLELSAEGGWDLLIEVDGQGRVAPGTRLVFPTGLGGTKMKLRCRPADPAVGQFKTATRQGSDLIGGHFQIDLAKCENAESGKAIEWPPAPLILTGNFVGVARIQGKS